jgi:hypothetical protein
VRFAGSLSFLLFNNELCSVLILHSSPVPNLVRSIASIPSLASTYTHSSNEFIFIMKLCSLLFLAGGVIALPAVQQSGKDNATSSCNGEKTAQLVAGINANLMIQAQELQGLVYFCRPDLSLPNPDIDIILVSKLSSPLQEPTQPDAPFPATQSPTFSSYNLTSLPSSSKVSTSAQTTRSSPARLRAHRRRG